MDDYILENTYKMLNVVREVNVTLRWLMLHSHTIHRKIRFIYIYIYMCVCVCVLCMYVCVCVCMCVYVCVYVCMCSVFSHPFIFSEKLLPKNLSLKSC